MPTSAFAIRRRLPVLALAATALFASGAVMAQGASGPIRIVVGASAGGTTDTLARSIAKLMEVDLKRPVIVENKPGAGGNIAAEHVARSTPDGDTLLMSFTSHTINPSIYKKMPFDTVKDFTPITMVAKVPSVLVASAKVPVGSVQELIDYAKKNPGKLNFAIGGTGSSLHMAGEQFKMHTGVDIVNVAYKGTTPAMTDVLAGHAELMFASTLNVLPHVGSGKIKVLGVTSAKPMPQFPGVPPIGATVPGFESNAWFGLFGPAKMPAATTDRLYQAASKAVQDPGFQKRLETDGGSPALMKPAEFSDFIVQDIQRWAKVVKFSGATVE
ncbi:MAG: tripartite tricarboxylate transporter substrate binding protein [Noviherbaspirillum sp.]